MNKGPGPNERPTTNRTNWLGDLDVLCGLKHLCWEPPRGETALLSDDPWPFVVSLLILTAHWLVCKKNWHVPKRWVLGNAARVANRRAGGFVPMAAGRRFSSAWRQMCPLTPASPGEAEPASDVSRDSVQTANGTVAVLRGSRPLCSGIAPASHRRVRSSYRRMTWRMNRAASERCRGRQRVATGGRFPSFFQHPYTSEP
jgi:hypothetical protein